MSAVPLAESYSYCARVAREQARNFYYSFLVLPREKRRALCAIYAFLRQSDDISDERGANQTKLDTLAAWRRRLERALDNDYQGSPLWPAFHDTLRRFSIPAEYFFELLRGAEMDLQGVTYRSFADLYRYCYRVAGVVGLTCIRVFGFPAERDREASELAESCGIAFQLTNILRDLREDARDGRTYLPAEDLERFGCHPESFRETGGSAALEKLVLFEAERAWTYYRRALPLLEVISPDSRAALWAMIALYASILKRIAAAPLRVFHRRAELSDLEKFQILARGLWMRASHNGRPLPAPF
jgi:phytoene synthase